MIKLYFGFLFISFFFLNACFSQKCLYKSKFIYSKSKSFPEDHRINVLNVVDENNVELSKYENPRTLIIQFYFDRTNIFNKSIEEFKTLLSESLPKKN